MYTPAMFLDCTKRSEWLTYLPTMCPMTNKWGKQRNPRDWERTDTLQTVFPKCDSKHLVHVPIGAAPHAHTATFYDYPFMILISRVLVNPNGTLTLNCTLIHPLTQALQNTCILILALITKQPINMTSKYHPQFTNRGETAPKQEVCTHKTRREHPTRSLESGWHPFPLNLPHILSSPLWVCPTSQAIKDSENQRWLCPGRFWAGEQTVTASHCMPTSCTHRAPVDSSQ